jgi:hypothetical protein
MSQMTVDVMGTPISINYSESCPHNETNFMLVDYKPCDNNRTVFHIRTNTSGLPEQVAGWVFGDHIRNNPVPKSLYIWMV